MDGRRGTAERRGEAGAPSGPVRPFPPWTGHRTRYVQTVSNGRWPQNHYSKRESG